MTPKDSLDALIGNWITKGFVIADDGSNGAVVCASDNYAWDASRSHILHYVNSNIGDSYVSGTEIITFDSETITAHLFNLPSAHSTSTISVSDDGRTLTWEAEANMCVGEFNADFSEFNAHHKRLTDDGEWVPAIEVTLHKIGS